MSTVLHGVNELSQTTVTLVIGRLEPSARAYLNVRRVCKAWRDVVDSQRMLKYWGLYAKLRARETSAAWQQHLQDEDERRGGGSSQGCMSQVTMSKATHVRMETANPFQQPRTHSP